MYFLLIEISFLSSFTFPTLSESTLSHDIIHKLNFFFYHKGHLKSLMKSLLHLRLKSPRKCIPGIYMVNDKIFTKSTKLRKNWEGQRDSTEAQAFFSMHLTLITSLLHDPQSTIYTPGLCPLIRRKQLG